MRQRVFYSLYVLGRFLSAEFGIPLMLSDTDIDTCLPGTHEAHSLMAAPIPTEGDIGTGDTRPNKRMKMHEQSTGHTDEARRRLLPCQSLSIIARVVGRAMETFNKAILKRSAAGEFKDFAILISQPRTPSRCVPSLKAGGMTSTMIRTKRQVISSSQLTGRATIRGLGSRPCSHAYIINSISRCIVRIWRYRHPLESTPMQCKLPLHPLASYAQPCGRFFLRVGPRQSACGLATWTCSSLAASLWYTAQREILGEDESCL